MRGERSGNDCSARDPSDGRDAGAGARRRASRGDGRRSDGRRHSKRHSDGHAINRSQDAGGSGPDRRKGRRHSARALAGALLHPRRVLRLRAAALEGRPAQSGGQQARRRAGAPGCSGHGYRRPRRERSGVGPAGHVRHRHDARADRRAVGRSRRDGAAAAGYGRRECGHPRRQLRGRPAAAEVGDQGHPHHSRRVRRREPLRRRALHRHHHPAWYRSSAHQPQHAAARRCAERQESARRGQGARAHPELQRRSCRAR